MEKTLEMRVEELERMLFLTKNVLSFDEASTFLNLSKSYLYKLTSGNLIPHYKPQGKMLYFEKSELEAWLRQNPVKTKTQIEQAKGDTIMNKEDFAALWKSIRLKVTDTYDVPPEILWVNGSTIGTLGNFSASTGKAKSKKTFNISAIVAAALTNDEVLHY